MGLTYGPLGTVLSELFPTAVRYTGSSLTFNFAGIFGASLAPYIADLAGHELRAAVCRLFFRLPRRSRWPVCSPRAKRKTKIWPARGCFDSLGI